MTVMPDATVGQKSKRKTEVSCGRITAGVVQYAALIIGAFVMLAPVLWMISTSLTADSVIVSYKLIPTRVTLENYVRAWTFPSNFDESVTLGTFFLNSVLVSALITGPALIIDSLAGYVLARRKVPGSNLLFYMALATMMIPFYVIAVPLFLTVRKLRWLDTYQGMVVPFLASGFGIFMFKQFFQTVPQDLEDAALVDGCSAWRTYWSIMLPLAKPVVGTMAIFKVMWSWNQFFWPLLIINNIRLKTLPLALTMFRGLNVTQWGTLCAGMTVATIPVVVVYLSMQDMFQKGITMGAVKG
ncbi:MAG TPA: carbohydrate ABC transporter permease [Bacillota bacterium]|jgi:ABC-type glycerol-3-phosphate transport system permease component|nr:carbohydrate ABC transporter permease [Bacillota bacterium]